MPGLAEKLIRRVVGNGAMRLARFNRARMPRPAAPHPFLTGLHRPMDRELTLEDLPVQGSIPPELDGRYVRIGPNPIRPPNPASHHWFLGDGMVHGIRLKQGRALWYRNRWVRSLAVSRALGEAPAPGPRHFSDTVNTSVMAHAGKLWAVVEAGGYPVELGETLETVAHNPFEGSLAGSFSAHPHRDVDSGELHAICYEATEQNVIRHVVVGPDGRVRRDEPIAVRHGPGVHDCMITRQYVIVLDLPVTFSMATLVAGYEFPYTWNPQHRARVGLLRRDAPGDSILWCDVPPCYVFHPCNGFEDRDGKVILDVVAHATMFEDSFTGPRAGVAAFERWTIDPAARRVDRRVVDDHAQEFPRADERRTGRPYRYAYAVPLEREHDGNFSTGNFLIKHDLETGSRQLHDFGPHRHPGEFVFQPRHPEAGEDEGWLMGYVVDAATETTDFVILDAARFGAAPQAVVALPHRIPTGFHGNWIPAAGMA